MIDYVEQQTQKLAPVVRSFQARIGVDPIRLLATTNDGRPLFLDIINLYPLVPLPGEKRLKSFDQVVEEYKTDLQRGVLPKGLIYPRNQTGFYVYHEQEGVVTPVGRYIWTQYAVHYPGQSVFDDQVLFTVGDDRAVPKVLVNRYKSVLWNSVEKAFGNNQFPFFVEREFRGKGLGSLLIAASLAFHNEKKITLLNTAILGLGSRRLWRRFGLPSVVFTAPQDFGEWEMVNISVQDLLLSPYAEGVVTTLVSPEQQT